MARTPRTEARKELDQARRLYDKALDHYYATLGEPKPVIRASEREHDVAILCAVRGLTPDEADLIWVLAQEAPESETGTAFIREIDGLITQLRGFKQTSTNLN
jgi:hypothetical protein